MTAPIVRAKDFGYIYPGAEHPSLENINLEIYPGEFVLLAGPSGSGVSTLMSALNGIVPHNKGGKATGEFWVAGRNVLETKTQEMAESVGLIFQDPETQLVSLFATEEVAFGPENFQIETHEIKRRVEETLRYVGLEGVENKFVYELSGGQKQRLALGSVLVMDPVLLGLDHPTANLDPVGIQEVKRVLETMMMSPRETTVIISDNAVDEFVHFATRLVVLRSGRVYAEGDPRTVLQDFGKEMRDQLGLWLPELVEIDLEVQKSVPVSATGMPFTVEEATKRYRGFGVVPENKATPNQDLADKEPKKPVVRVENVSFSYPDGTRAVRDVSFSIRPRTLTALVGPNGCGKTTLAKLIVGLLKPGSGEIVTAGINVKEATVAELTKRVGFVFQNPEHQFVRDSVREEIAYSLEVLGRPNAEVKSGVDEMLRLFDLERMADRHPFTLSGGEKRRLSVAAMLVEHPDLLVLDEPTYGQDRRTVNQIMDLVLSQLEKGVTVLMITHSMQIVQEYADDVVFVEDGTVSYQGPAKYLWEEEDTRFTSLPKPMLPRIIGALRREGLPLPLGCRTATQFARLLTSPASDLVRDSSPTDGFSS